MELESLFGLPAHPLLVHGAVVLVPLAAIGTVLIAVSARLRRQLGVAVAVLAVVAFGFTFLAKQSGEPLEEQVDETEAVEEHAELGEVMPLFAGLLMLTSVGVVALDVYGRRAGGGAPEGTPTSSSATGGPAGPPSWVKPAATAMAVLAILASVGATVQVTLVGHSGAEATWDEEGEGGEGREEHEDDDDEDEEGTAVLAPVVVDGVAVIGAVRAG